MLVKFQLFISHNSRDIKGSQMLLWGVKLPLKLVSHFGVKIHPLFGVDRGGSLISALRGQLSMWSFVAKLFAI